MKSEKMTFRATFRGFGSECRSAMCSLESGYIWFESNNGEVFKWFSDKGLNMRPKNGQRFEITATVTEQNTLQRPIFTALPMDCFDN